MKTPNRSLKAYMNYMAIWGLPNYIKAEKYLRDWMKMPRIFRIKYKGGQK